MRVAMPESSPTWKSDSLFQLKSHNRWPEAHYVTRKSNLQHAQLHRNVRCLITIFDVTKSNSSSHSSTLESEYQRFLQVDDVFRPEFLHGIVILTDSGHNDTNDLRDLFAKWGTRWWITIKRDDFSVAPASGPYLLDPQGLSEVWRLYDDFNKAFLAAVWPNPDDSSAFDKVNIAGEVFSTLAVPVPSRLYSQKTAELPLAGVRIAIKDIFHLRGVKTSCCSRQYHDFYPAQTTTATCIQQLLDLGACLVGKLHLSMFAMREDPTECVDYQAPFNPRGDGYQSPAGSSSGSGAAIASYDWLDFTIGTDTTGSGRRPALWNGAFGMRPSGQIFDAKGMVATCPLFDSPSFFGRSVRICREVASAWYQDRLPTPSDSKLPWNLLWPTDFLPVANAEQMEALVDFGKELEGYLGIKARKISLVDEWRADIPEAAKGQELNDYLENVQEHFFFYDAYHCFDEFRNDFVKASGSPPYVTEILRWMWGIGRLIGVEQREESLRRFEVFRTWFTKKILQVNTYRTIMMLPIEKLEPRYRDVPPGPPSVPPKSINVLYVSPALHGPEFVVPVGQVAYNSRVTEKIEYLPCAVSLLAEPGSDIELMEMVEGFLSASKRPLEVETGKSMGSGFAKYNRFPDLENNKYSWLDE